MLRVQTFTATIGASAFCVHVSSFHRHILASILTLYVVIRTLADAHHISSFKIHMGLERWSVAKAPLPEDKRWGVICIRRNSLGCGDGQQLAQTSGDGFVAALKSTTTSFLIMTEACASGSHYDRTSCSPTWLDSGTYIYFYRLLCPVQPSWPVYWP